MTDPGKNVQMDAYVVGSKISNKLLPYTRF